MKNRFFWQSDRSANPLEKTFKIRGKFNHRKSDERFTSKSIQTLVHLVDDKT